MQAQQTIGIDLPLKALAWQDKAGKTWLTWNEPAWLAARHGFAGQGGEVAKTLGGVTAALAKEATTKADRKACPDLSGTQRRSTLFVAGPGAHHAIAPAKFVTAAQRRVFGLAEMRADRPAERAARLLGVIPSPPVDFADDLAAGPHFFMAATRASATLR